jgi:SAM-dependent methyltransferase
MMFGFRDTFAYIECAQCGCLFIEAFPDNIERYYPTGYYSFRQRPDTPLARFIRKQRDAYVLWHRGVLGKVLLALHPGDMNVVQSLQSLARLRLPMHARILDAGCGSGVLLDSLRGLGFTNLLGIDPHIEADTTSAGGVPILKRALHHLEPGNQESTWDGIMFHHSLEHIANQRETLECVANLLAPAGVCIVRMPTVSSYAWKNYRSDWAQLDAPRHAVLHSIRSMKVLASQVHLHLEDVVYDSTAFQFWASEQYRRDIPLVSETSYATSPAKSPFSSADIRRFEHMAVVLNRAYQGDTAVFYLRKPYNREG